MSSANEKQEGGNHYQAAGGYQHWDMVHEHKLDYFQGAITKYVMRCWAKNGIEDLKKAQHFLEKYIELNANRKGSAEVSREEAAKTMRNQVASVAELVMADLRRGRDEALRAARDATEQRDELVGIARDAVKELEDYRSLAREHIPQHLDRLGEPGITVEDIMRHHSDAYFVFEGIKENKVMYRCRKCRAYNHIPITGDIHTFHQCGVEQAGNETSTEQIHASADMRDAVHGAPAEDMPLASQPQDGSAATPAYTDQARDKVEEHSVT